MTDSTKREAAHTPGPWFVDFYTDTGGFFVYADNPTATICSRGPWSHRKDESEANARLIAAAPEMLDALQMAKHIVANEGTDAQMAQVFAAIENATGAAA